MEAQPAATEIVDDGTRRDRRGRMKVEPARREELLAEYRQSGLSQAAFAQRAGVNYQAFAHWVQRTRRALADTGSVARPPAPSFAEVRIAGAPGGATDELCVTLTDGVVVRGRESAAVAALGRALRANTVAES